MTGIVDTHTFIWWDSNPGRLTTGALAFLQDPANTILFSVASAWEIVIKQQLGKLALNLPLATILTHHVTNGLTILPITLDHVLAVSALPSHHKDPFDRILAAQCHVTGAVILTADPVFHHYPVQVIW